jgi:endonuclease/exonuclease/phosphatase family metal-dependent hydrolase
MTTPKGKTIRVATYNVHGCVGRDGRHDPERVSAVIDELDADVVALQEFSYPADVALETRTPVTLVALDDYRCVYGPTRKNLTHCFGNILLTRHHLAHVRRIDLSIERREPRGALAATIRIDGLDLHVLAAHLGLRLSERRFQIRQIVEYLASVAGTAAVVLGDFNDWLPGRSVVHLLDQRLGHAPRPASFPVVYPFLALDRVWVEPARALQTLRVHKSELARRASDHYPVIAEIELGSLLSHQLAARHSRAVQD